MKEVDDGNDLRLRIVNLKSMVQFWSYWNRRARLVWKNGCGHLAVYRCLKDRVMGEGNQVIKGYIEDQKI